MANWARYVLELPQNAGRSVIRRTQHSIHFQRQDGLIEAYFSCTPCHWWDGSSWQELDTTLREGAGYWSAPSVPVRIWANKLVELTGSAYAQRTTRVALLDGATKSVKWATRVPVGSVSDDSLVASGVVGGADWEHRLRLTENGVVETLIIFSLPSITGADTDDWLVIETQVYGISFPDGWLNDFTYGGIQFPLPFCHDAQGQAADCRRYARTANGVQYIYTGIPVTWLAQATYPIVIDPDFVASTSYALIYGSSSTYSTARSTSTGLYTTSATVRVGQYRLSEPGETYAVSRTYLNFDTSSLEYSPIVQANLYLAVESDLSSTDFDVQIVKQNWSAQDPVTSANRETVYDNCLSSPVDTNWRNTAGVSIATPYASNNLDPAWISRVGKTYYSLRSNYDADNTAPTGLEYIELFSPTYPDVAYRPTLAVVYAPASFQSATAGNGTTAAYAPYDDIAWTNPQNATAYDGNEAVAGSTIVPSLRSVGAYGSGTTSCVAAVPTGGSAPQAGDILLIVVESSNSTTAAGTPATPAGWTKLFERTQNAGATGVTTLTIFGKRAGASESNVTITGAANHCSARMFVFKDCISAGDAWVVGTGGGAGSGNATVSSITTPVDNCLVIAVVGTTRDANSTSQFSNWANASLDGLTEIADNTTNSGAGGGFGVACGLKTTAGATNSTTVTLATSEAWNAVHIALKPLPGFDTGQISQLLKLNNFGFSLPADAIIEGVTAFIDRRALAANSVQDECVSLLGADGGLTGNNYGNTAIAWPTTTTTALYGAHDDTWGTSLTPSIINDSDFGIALAVESIANSTVARVDHVALTVCYTRSAVSKSVAISGTGSVKTYGISPGIKFIGVSTATVHGEFVTIPRPNGVQDGDLLLAFTAVTNNASELDGGYSSTLSPLFIELGPLSLPALGVWYRWCGPTEPSYYVVTLNGNTENSTCAAAILAYHGVSLSWSQGDFHNSNSGLEGNQYTAPSITTNQGGCNIVVAYAFDFAETIGTVSIPAPLSERCNVATNTAPTNQCRLAIGTLEQTEASETGTFTATATTGGFPWIAITLYLAPLVPIGGGILGEADIAGNGVISISARKTSLVSTTTHGSGSQAYLGRKGSIAALTVTLGGSVDIIGQIVVAISGTASVTAQCSLLAATTKGARAPPVSASTYGASNSIGYKGGLVAVAASGSSTLQLLAIRSAPGGQALHGGGTTTIIATRTTYVSIAQSAIGQVSCSSAIGYMGNVAARAGGTCALQGYKSSQGYTYSSAWGLLTCVAQRTALVAVALSASGLVDGGTAKAAHASSSISGTGNIVTTYTTCLAIAGTVILSGNGAGAIEASKQALAAPSISATGPATTGGHKSACASFGLGCTGTLTTLSTGFVPSEVKVSSGGVAVVAGYKNAHASSALIGTGGVSSTARRAVTAAAIVTTSSKVLALYTSQLYIAEVVSTGGYGTVVGAGRKNAQVIVHAGGGGSALAISSVLECPRAEAELCGAGAASGQGFKAALASAICVNLLHLARESNKNAIGEGAVSEGLGIVVKGCQSIRGIAPLEVDIRPRAGPRVSIVVISDSALIQRECLDPAQLLEKATEITITCTDIRGRQR